MRIKITKINEDILNQNELIKTYKKHGIPVEIKNGNYISIEKVLVNFNELYKKVGKFVDAVREHMIRDEVTTSIMTLSDIIVNGNEILKKMGKDFQLIKSISNENDKVELKYKQSVDNKNESLSTSNQSLLKLFVIYLRIVSILKSNYIEIDGGSYVIKYDVLVIKNLIIKLYQEITEESSEEEIQNYLDLNFKDYKLTVNQIENEFVSY